MGAEQSNSQTGGVTSKSELRGEVALIFVPRNSRNILVKSVSFYLERFQDMVCWKNVQLFWPPCALVKTAEQVAAVC